MKDEKNIDAEALQLKIDWGTLDNTAAWAVGQKKLDKFRFNEVLEFTPFCL